MGRAIADFVTLSEVAAGSHVCWIVGDQDDFVGGAARLLGQTSTANEKPVVFGPEGSAQLAALAPLAAVAVDPRTAFLGGGPLDPPAMFAMFEEQSALARADGFRGLRLVADMDWLVPAAPTTDDIVAFELLLDRQARRLGATIVCAYREASFDTAALTGARCVHPVGAGRETPTQFRLVAGDADTWRLVGAVDLAVAADFRSAIGAAAAGRCVVDASGVDFIALAGLREIAEAARLPQVTLRIVGAPPIVRRAWRAAGFADAVPTAEVVG